MATVSQKWSLYISVVLRHHVIVLSSTPYHCLLSRSASATSLLQLTSQGNATIAYGQAQGVDIIETQLKVNKTSVIIEQPEEVGIMRWKVCVNSDDRDEEKALARSMHA